MTRLLADFQVYVPVRKHVLAPCSKLTPASQDIPVTIYCEFILFTSLATLYNKQEDARVVFFHVPGSETEEDIEKGAEVLKALICAMVEQRGA